MTDARRIVDESVDRSFYTIETFTPPQQPITNTARFYVQIADRDFAGGGDANAIEYGGFEVAPVFDGGRVQWVPVPNGRVLDLGSTDDTVYATALVTNTNFAHAVGSIVPVIEQYDDDGRLCRWIDYTPSSDVRVGRIIARSGTTNATYTVEDVRNPGVVLSGVSPANRITAPSDGITWNAASVGAFCLILFAAGSVPEEFVAVWIAERATIAECP